MKHKVVIRLALSALLMGLAGSASVMAQQRALTLQEAIDLSVKNSKQLRGSAAKIEEATAALKEAVERKLPDATATGSYLRVSNPTVDLKIKSNNSSGNEGSTAKVSQAAYGMANVSLPLYSGLRIRYGIESSRLLEQATRLDADRDREAVILNTIDAFNNLYKSRASVDLVNKNLEEARQRVADFTNLEKNGLLARNDLLKAELQQSNTELALLDAQNNWKLANINMVLMLGLPDSTEILPDSTAFRQTPDARTFQEFMQIGEQNRKDLAALDYRKKAAETGVKAAQGEKLPSVALTGGYVALDIPNALIVYNAVNIGIGVQYNIGSLWKANSKIQQAKARVKQIQANEDQLSDAIKLQIGQAYQNYLSSQKKIEVFNKAVAQAEENYRIVNNKFTNNLATATDLLDADVARLQARLNYAYAQSDAYVAYSRLLEASGILKANNNQ